MNQTVRLESKAGDLIETVQLAGEGNEPDAILVLRDNRQSVFIRRPMLQTQPPTKNSPERYYEATTLALSPSSISAPRTTFDKVTETSPTRPR
jgi:hypothetical protein